MQHDIFRHWSQLCRNVLSICCFKVEGYVALRTPEFCQQCQNGFASRELAGRPPVPSLQLCWQSENAATNCATFSPIQAFFRFCGRKIPNASNGSSMFGASTPPKFKLCWRAAGCGRRLHGDMYGTAASASE